MSLIYEECVCMFEGGEKERERGGDQTRKVPYTCYVDLYFSNSLLAFGNTTGFYTLILHSTVLVN